MMRTPLLDNNNNNNPTTTANNNDYDEDEYDNNSQHSLTDNNQDNYHEQQHQNQNGQSTIQPSSSQHHQTTTTTTTTKQQINWKDTLKDYMYGKQSPNPKPKRTRKWKRYLLSCIRLPWTAFFLLAVALAIVIFFGVIISGKAQPQPANTTLYDPNTGRQIEKLTIPCDTDVSDEVCQTIIANVAATKDFQQTVTESHLFITLGTFWLATSLYLVVKAIRGRRRDMYLTSLPHPSVWFENPAVWRGEADVGSGSRSVLRRIPVQEQMHRSITLTRLMRQYDPLETKGDLTWEKVFEDDSLSSHGIEKEVHWPTLVSEGWTRLVDKACVLDPSLAIKRECTVREFVLDILAKRVNDPKWELVARRWVDTYERVKFGDVDVYQHDCELFFDDFHVLRGKLAEMIEEQEFQSPDYLSMLRGKKQHHQQQPPPPQQHQQQQQLPLRQMSGLQLEQGNSTYNNNNNNDLGNIQQVNNNVVVEHKSSGISISSTPIPAPPTTTSSIAPTQIVPVPSPSPPPITTTTDVAVTSDSHSPTSNSSTTNYRVSPLPPSQFTTGSNSSSNLLGGGELSQQQQQQQQQIRSRRTSLDSSVTTIRTPDGSVSSRVVHHADFLLPTTSATSSTMAGGNTSANITTPPPPPITRPRVNSQ
jgi:hypothetical protein